MMSWRWKSSLVLLLSVFFLVVGCGSTAGGGATQTTNGTNNTAGAPSDKTVTITWWHAMSGRNGKIIDAMAKKFNDSHPGIKVITVFKGSYRETLNGAIQAARSDNGPSIVQIFEVGTRQAIDSGIFLPVQDLLGNQLDASKFLDPVLNYYRIGGKLYSMPFNSSNPILYYNKDMFKKAGLDPNQPPTTFEGVEQASKAIVQKGVAQYGITWPLHSWFFEQWMGELGADLVNKGNGREAAPTKINLDSTAAKTIFTWWKRMADEKLWLNPGIEAWTPAEQAFLSGKTAMLITSTASVASLTESAQKQHFELGTSLYPIPANSQRNGVIIGGASLWVAKKQSKEQLEATKKFVLWLTEPDQQALWNKETGYFPVVKGAVDQLQKEGWFDKNANYKVTFDQLLNTKASSATAGALMGNFLEARTDIEKAFESVLAGTPVEQALSDAKTKIDKGMADYIKIVGGQ